MVGLQTLDLAIGVRVPASQLFWNEQERASAMDALSCLGCLWCASLGSSSRFVRTHELTAERSWANFTIYTNSEHEHAFFFIVSVPTVKEEQSRDS